MVLLDTLTPGTSPESYSEDADGENQLATPGLQNPVLYPMSYTAQKAIARKELSLSSWGIANLIYLSFLNCD